MPSIRVDQVVEGSAVDIVVEFEDADGNLVGIDGPATVDIHDASGTEVVSGGTMSQELQGRWVYYHQTSEGDPLGMWKVIGEADVDTSGGTRTERAKVYFELVSG